MSWLKIMKFEKNVSLKIAVLFDTINILQIYQLHILRTGKRCTLMNKMTRPNIQLLMKIIRIARTRLHPLCMSLSNSAVFFCNNVQIIYMSKA